MKDELIEKMRRWCSKQERCTFEVRRKLQQANVSESDQKKILEALEREGFLSNARFLESYVRTHAEYKRWGPLKIAAGLRTKGFTSTESNQAINEASGDLFDTILCELVQKKEAELLENRERVIRFLLSRGFRVDDILKSIDEARLR